MIYKTLKGTILESSPNQIVTHTEQNNELDDGIYESLETTGANNQFGIKQIKVVRVVDSGEITYTITESTEAELQAYIESVTQNN